MSESNPNWRERLHYFESEQPALVAHHPRIRGDRIPQRQQARRRPHGPFHRRAFRSLRRTPALPPRHRLRQQPSNRFPQRRKKINPFCSSATSTRSTRWARSPPCPARKPTDRLHGPGVLDMKSGIALMLYAIEALQSWHSGLAAARHGVSSFRRRSRQQFFAQNHRGSRPRIRSRVRTRTRRRNSWSSQDCTQRCRRLHAHRERRRRSRRPRPRQRTQRHPRTRPPDHRHLQVQRSTTRNLSQPRHHPRRNPHQRSRRRSHASKSTSASKKPSKPRVSTKSSAP